MCKKITNFLKKDGTTIDPSASARPKVDGIAEGLECDLCGTSLEILDSDSEKTITLKKNHYMQACKAIPGVPVLTDTEFSTKDAVRRVAALGTVKKVGFIDCDHSQPDVSATFSLNSDNPISLKENPPPNSMEEPH